jgi:hypothetical protein
LNTVGSIAESVVLIRSTSDPKTIDVLGQCSPDDAVCLSDALPQGVGETTAVLLRSQQMLQIAQVLQDSSVQGVRNQSSIVSPDMLSAIRSNQVPNPLAVLLEVELGTRTSTNGLEDVLHAMTVCVAFSGLGRK